MTKKKNQRDRMTTPSIMVSSEMLSLLKDIADIDGTTTEQVTHAVLGKFITQRARTDPKFADRVRMVEEQVVVTALPKHINPFLVLKKKLLIQILMVQPLVV